MPSWPSVGTLFWPFVTGRMPWDNQEVRYPEIAAYASPWSIQWPRWAWAPDPCKLGSDAACHFLKIPHDWQVVQTLLVVVPLCETETTVKGTHVHACKIMPGVGSQPMWGLWNSAGAPVLFLVLLLEFMAKRVGWQVTVITPVFRMGGAGQGA